MTPRRPLGLAGATLAPQPTNLTLRGFPERSGALGRVWTARYSNPRIPDSGLAPVRITVGFPRFRLRYSLAATLRELAPDRAWLHIDDRAAFSALYCAKLDALGVDAIRRLLDEVRAAAGTDPVLLCFEDCRKPGEWCHRLAFAEWWHERTGEPVLELDEGG